MVHAKAQILTPALFFSKKRVKIDVFQRCVDQIGIRTILFPSSVLWSMHTGGPHLSLLKVIDTYI